jgi:hypothetical protein
MSSFVLPFPFPWLPGWRQMGMTPMTPMRKAEANPYGVLVWVAA